MCMPHRNDDRPRGSRRSAPGMDHPAHAPIADEISKIETFHLRLAWVAGREKPGADVAQLKRGYSPGLGCSDPRSGKRNRIGCDCLQRVRQRGPGMDETVADAWVSANFDSADAFLQTIIP